MKAGNQAGSMTVEGTPYSHDEMLDASTGSPSVHGVDRAVQYEHSMDLAELLQSIQCSLLVSTYQAGKLVSIGAAGNQLDISFHNFQRPMGVAIDACRRRISIASKDTIWHLQNGDSFAPQIDPAGRFSSCFVTRSSSVTGDIQAHEMAWSGDQLWIVNTLFSCLCTLDDKHSFVPIWRPHFVSDLAPEDRCHLNGLACVDGQPKYVTAMAESNTAGGWRADKVKTGCLIDVESNVTVATGFAMPHSPRIHGDDVYLLDSGRGGLVRIDRSGHAETIARFPGYTRGLAIHGSLAFVGLSKIRETSTFGGVPIADERDRLKCGVAIVDVSSGKLVGQFEFQSGVSEIFDVRLLPSNGLVSLHGPYATDEGSKPIWVLPRPD
ncbi:TIGR03032 family protein [Planctomycetota bacterium]